jgi:hypothetical protein
MPGPGKKKSLLEISNEDPDFKGAKNTPIQKDYDYDQLLKDFSPVEKKKTVPSEPTTETVQPGSEDTSLKSTLYGDPENKFSLQNLNQEIPIDNTNVASPLDVDIEAHNKEADEVEKYTQEREKYLESLDDGTGVVSSVLSSGTQGLANSVGGLSKSIGIVAKKLDWFNEYEGKKAEDLATYKFGQWLEDSAKELFPSNPKYQDSFLVNTLPNAGGNMLGYALGGLGSRALKVSSGLTVGTLGATQTAAQEYKNALISNGGNEDDAFDVFIYNLPVGGLEAVPLAKFFKRMDNTTGGAVKKYLTNTGIDKIQSLGKTTTGAATIGGLQEMTQEIASNALTNTIASETYDKTREIFDGAAEEGAAGFILGGLLNGLGVGIKNKMQDAKSLEEKANLEASLKFVEDKQKELADKDPDDIVFSEKSEKVVELQKQKARLESDIISGNLSQELKAPIIEKIKSIDSQIQEQNTLDRKETGDKVLQNATKNVLESQRSEFQKQLENNEISNESKAIITEEIAKLDSQLKEIFSPGDVVELSPEINNQNTEAEIIPETEVTTEVNLESESEIPSTEETTEAEPAITEQPEEVDLSKKIEYKNTLIGKINDYNKSAITKDGKIKKETRAISEQRQLILQEAQKQGYTVKNDRGKLTLLDTEGKKVNKTPIKQDTSNFRNLEEREESVRNFYNDLDQKGHLGVTGTVGSGKFDVPLSEKEFQKAKADIAAGIKSVPAETLLNFIQDIQKTGRVPFSIGEGINNQKVDIPLDEFLGNNVSDQEVIEFLDSKPESNRLETLLMEEYISDQGEVNWTKLRNDIESDPEMFTNFVHGLSQDEFDTLKEVVYGQEQQQQTFRGEPEESESSTSVDEDSETGEQVPEETGEVEVSVSEESQTPPPPPPSKEEAPVKEEAPNKKEKSFPKQVLDDPDISDEIKKGLSEDTLTYIPKSNKLTNKEANAIIDAKGIDQALNDLLDKNNGMEFRVRAVLGQSIIKRSNQEAKEATSETAKNKALDRAIQAAEFISEFSKDLGQGVQAFSIFSKLSYDGIIRRYERKLKVERKKLIEKLSPDIQNKKEILDKTNEQLIEEFLSDPELKKIIESKLKSGKGKTREKFVKNAIDALEKLKIDTKGKAFDALYGLTAETINLIITAVQKALKAGNSVVTSINKGIAEYKKNNDGEFEEENLRNFLFENLKQYEGVIDPDAAVKRGLKDMGTTIREVIKKHYTQVDNIKRNLTEKLISEAGLEESDAKELAKKIEESFAKLATQAKQKALKREMKIKDKIQPGVSKSIDDKLIELSNLGALSHEDFNKVYAEKLGIKELTDADKQRIMELSEKIQEADQFAEDTEKNFTDENIKKHIKLQEERLIAVNEIAEILSDKLPKDVWDTLSTVLQGNLLTPISIVTNVYSNILLQTLRYASRVSSQGMDYIYSKVAKKPRVIDVLAASKGYRIGFKEGALTGTKELKTGNRIDEIKRLEISRGFKPIQSLLRGLDRKSTQTIEERLNNLVEGTMGMPAEVMFRLLNFGDKPFQRAAELAKAYELASLKGLEGKELQKFILFPDPESAETIKAAGEEATFKSNSGPGQMASQWVSGLYHALGKIPVVGGPAKLLLKSQFPYIKTPVNIILETFDFALPQLSMAKAIYYGKKNNRAKAMEFLGKAAVGAMIQVAADLLMDNDLLSGDSEDDKKERALQFQAFPPKGVNISGLQRLLAGEDPAQKKDDTFITYEKMGAIGVILNMRANLGNKKKAEGSKFSNLFEELTYDTFSSIPNSASTALEMSFLHGANTFLEAVNKGEWDDWLANTFNAVSSIPLPNTLSTMSRAYREEIPELRDDNLMTRLNNVIKAKTFQEGDLPVKIDLWGNKVEQTPEGRNPFLYHLFDVSKARNISADPLSFGVYNLWKETGDNDVIPSIPSRNFNYDGKQVKLNYKQYENLLQLIGKSRKVLVEQYINTEEFKNAPNDEKIQILKHVYEEGLANAKSQFVEENFFSLTNTKK